MRIFDGAMPQKDQPVQAKIRRANRLKSNAQLEQQLDGGDAAHKAANRQIHEEGTLDHWPPFILIQNITSIPENRPSCVGSYSELASPGALCRRPTLAFRAEHTSMCRQTAPTHAEAVRTDVHGVESQPWPPVQMRQRHGPVLALTSGGSQARRNM